MVASRSRKPIVAAAAFWLTLLTAVRLTAGVGGQVPDVEVRCSTARVVDPASFRSVTGARHEIEADYLADERLVLEHDVALAPWAAGRPVHPAGLDGRIDRTEWKATDLPAIPEAMRYDLDATDLSLLITAFQRHGDDATITFKFTASGLVTVPQSDTASAPFLAMHEDVHTRWRRIQGIWKDVGPEQASCPLFEIGDRGCYPDMRATSFDVIQRFIRHPGGGSASMWFD